jgi:4'-phosphopantetheinyl transferase
VIQILDPNDVHVWVAATDIGVEECGRYRAILSIDERARANRFVFEADRIRYVASHGLMRVRLGEYSDTRPENLEFGAGVHGKPYLSDPATPLQFNLSHSGTLAVLAVTCSCPCGVDVEIVRSKINTEAIAGRFFCSHENAWLRSRPALQSRHGFFRLWAVKEAILKASGMGLSLPLSSIDATDILDGTSSNISFPDGVDRIRRFWVKELNVEGGYTAAVALETAVAISPEVQLFRR